MEMAHSTVCMHNLREIGHSLMMYRMDHHGWLPVGATSQETETGGRATGGTSDVWFLKLFPGYLGDLNVLACPADPYGYRMELAQGRIDDGEVADYPSYGLNSFIMTAGGGALAHIDRYRIRAEATILMADLGPDHTPASTASPGQVRGPSRNRSLLAWDDGFDVFEGSGESWLTARHGDGINVLTVAGGIRVARTVDVLRNPILNYYLECAAAGCTLCNELELFHYSFAKDQIYWWMGPAPNLGTSGSGS